MALYMPTNVMPSTLGTFGGGIVDASLPLVVSWQVDGGSPMTAYQIDILQNTTSSVLLYSTGRITENCPFYGRDETGKVVLFSHTVTTDELRASDIRNGGTYKLLVTQWWSEADSVTQQSASVFICRETPVLTVTDFQESVDTKRKTWNAKCVLPGAGRFRGGRNAAEGHGGGMYAAPYLHLRRAIQRHKLRAALYRADGDGAAGDDGVEALHSSVQRHTGRGNGDRMRFAEEKRRSRFVDTKDLGRQRYLLGGVSCRKGDERFPAHCRFARSAKERDRLHGGFQCDVCVLHLRLCRRCVFQAAHYHR